jgi:5-methylcytosine-specific restriction protein A
MKKPSLDEVKNGMARYRNGERPWPERKVDWFIASDAGALFPLKYIYGLATDQQVNSFTTDQAKGAMRTLSFGFVSLKAQAENIDQFESAVLASRKDAKGRAKRLKNAPRQPTQYLTTQLAFRRNPDVVAEVLERAKGTCEACGGPAPFVRKSDGSPYLEVHHKEMLANGGEDTVANAIAICPNCHREAHFGKGLVLAKEVTNTSFNVSNP